MRPRPPSFATAAWRRVVARLRPAPIDTVEALQEFLEERALLVAQKCAIDYCRGKTGLASHALFTEKPFLDALEVCRWESFTAVLADLIILAETALRPHTAADGRARLRDALLALYGRVLQRLPPVAHRPQGWGDVIAAFRERFNAACLRAPHRALDVADHSAKRLFETLPIHSRMREPDEEVIYGAVRFRMIAVNQQLQERLDGAALARRLLA